MLLHEAHGDIDEHSCQEERPFPESGRKPLRIPGPEHHGHGANDVEGGTDIGIGVEVIEGLGQTGEEIVPDEFRRPQVLLRGPDHINKQRQGVGESHEVHELPEAFRLPEGQIYIHSH